MAAVFVACVMVLFGGTGAVIAGLVCGWCRLADCFGWMALFCAGGTAVAFSAGYPFWGSLMAALSAGYGVLWWTHRRRARAEASRGVELEFTSRTRGGAS